jgi:hypothetical protein
LNELTLNEPTLNEPTHRIWRQVLEFEVRQASRDTAWRLQNRLSRLHRQHIVPLIDQCCTELSPPGHIHRIESLVIDLGNLDPSKLQHDLLKTLRPRLRQALAEHIAKQEHRESVAARHQESPESPAELELLALFADTGNVPWWADSSRSNLVDVSLGLLIRRAPRTLATWIRRLARDRGGSKDFPHSSSITSPVLSGQGLRRIVLHCDDERLVELFGILESPSRRALAVRGRQPMALLHACRAASGATSARFRSTAWRNALWLAVLQTACLNETSSPGSEDFWREALARVATELHTNYSSVVVGLRHVLSPQTHQLDEAGQLPSNQPSPPTRQPGLSVLDLEEIWRVLAPSPQKVAAGRQSGASRSAKPSSETGKTPQPTPSAETLDPSPLVVPDSSLEEIERILDRLRRGHGPLKSLFTALRSVAGRLPNRLRGQWWTILKDLEAPTPPEKFYASDRGREGDAGDFHPTRVRILLRLLAPLIERRLLSFQEDHKGSESPHPPRVSLPAGVIRRSLAELREPWDEGLETEEANELIRLLQRVVAEEGITPETASIEKPNESRPAKTPFAHLGQEKHLAVAGDLARNTPTPEPTDSKQVDAEPTVRFLPVDEPVPAANESVNESQEIEQVIDRLFPQIDPLTEIFQELRRQAKHFSPRVRDEWSQSLRKQLPSPPPDTTTPHRPTYPDAKEKIQPARAATLLRLLRPLFGAQKPFRQESRKQVTLPAAVTHRCLKALEGSPGAAVPAGVSTELARLLRQSTLPTTRQEPAAFDNESTVPPRTTPTEFGRTPFSETDTVCVENSGLVLLWPFLGHFFEHLGLMTERITPQARILQFRDKAVRQRAVSLLQYLVTEDPSPPEYQVTLGKVLCGMRMGEVFEPGDPISSAEAEECTNLLSAAIAQAPILKNMSTEGLRGTFLLRKGTLSTCDGVWLLRVERQAYDLVIDRFPWGVSWVKLPWMEAPLRVEW